MLNQVIYLPDIKFGTLKEFFTAQYDSNTDRIIGCTKNTIVYYHEEGHRDFNNRGYKDTSNLYVGYCYLLILTTLTMQNYTFSKLFLLIILSFLLLEEIYAWIFCVYKIMVIKGVIYDAS